MPLSSPSVRSRARLAWTAAAVAAGSLLAVVTGPAGGQLRLRGMAPALPGDATAATAKDAPPGVTVPDSPGAVERLAQADDKAKQQQWQTAAEFYREAATKFPGRVVLVPDGKAPPTDADAAVRTYRYAGVAAVAQDRIAKWPVDGLTAYRTRYGPAAADRLAGAGRDDWGAITGVFVDDFVTDAGKAAGLRLIDGYTEAGRFAAAAAVGDRLLAAHPLLGPDRPSVLFRTALTHHWAGDDAAAKRCQAELQKTDAKAIGTVGGKDVVLADALGPLLTAAAPAPAIDPAAADTYPSFGGPGGRGDPSPSTAKPGASLIQIELTKPDFAGHGRQQEAGLKVEDDQSVRNGGASGVIPVVDAGTLFLQDGRTVYAVDADSGRPPAAWRATYPPDAKGQNEGRYRTGAAGRARNQQLTVTVTPGHVLAVMGQSDPILSGEVNANSFGGRVFIRGGGRVFANGEIVTAPASTVKLVCLDRATGRFLWDAKPDALPESAGAVRSAEYVGTPLAVTGAVAGTPGEEAVLVAARGGRDAQFDDCYVVCLSAATGQYRWSTYVGGGARNPEVDAPAADSDPSQLALADGRAFVMTNLGSVSALDPADGRVVWLMAYPRDGTDFGTDADRLSATNNSGNGPASRAWEANPVIVQGGHVFALPSDAKELFVLDAATGEVRQRVVTTDLPPLDRTTNGVTKAAASVLLGVHGETAHDRSPAAEFVVLADRLNMYVLNWRTYNPADPRGHGYMQHVGLTAREASANTADGSDEIVGRGFLSAGSIFVTTQQHLHQEAWQGDAVREVATYPQEGEFTSSQGPGNVLATSQSVVVAGPDRVGVYTDLDVVGAKYAAEMAAAPADPDPRVRYAQALFAAGRWADAVARLDQAIDLIGGRGGMRPGPDRDRVFDALLDFARHTAGGVASSNAADAPPDGTKPDAVTADQRSLVEGLFDRAADAADAPAQRVAYLLARARYDADDHRDAAAVALLQQVLSTPALRQVNVTDEQTGGGAAAAAITAAVKDQPSAYAPVEARAAVALAAAKDKNDATAALAVADEFPNSRAAGDARESAVTLLLAARQPVRAVDVLVGVYAKTTDPPAQAALLHRIAAAYLTAGPDGVGPAVDRLAWSAHLSTDGRLAADLHLPNGGTLAAGSDTIVAAVDALRDELARRSTAALPDFRLATLDQARDRYAAAHGGPPTEVYQGYSPFLPPPSPTVADVVTLVHPTRGFDRFDRVVTWSPAGLAAFDAGQVTPRFRSAGFDQAPLGAAWAGGRCVVWNSTRVVALTDDGHDAWPVALVAAQLPAPAAAAVPPGEAVVDAQPDPTAVNGGNGGNGGNGVIHGQVFVRGGGRIIIRNGRPVRLGMVPVVAPVAPVPPAALALDEQVASVTPAVGPAGAAVVVATTRGRIVAVDVATGSVRWQARAADRTPDAVVANGRYAVVRVNDATGAKVVIYAVATGRVVGRNAFGPDGSPTQLVNLALSEEATLVLTLGNTVEVKDLYLPLVQVPRPLVAQTMPDPMVFNGLVAPDQLLAAAGRVVAMYDAGRAVRTWDASRPPPADPNASSDPAAAASACPASAGPPLTLPAATGPGGTPLPPVGIAMRLDGPRLFVLLPNDLREYNLADPADRFDCQGKEVDIRPPQFRGFAVGRGHVLAIDDPVDRGPTASPHATVVAVSRATLDGSTRERGNWDFVYVVAPKSGVADWAAVDGGLYVLTGDHKLVFCAGGNPRP